MLCINFDKRCFGLRFGWFFHICTHPVALPYIAHYQWNFRGQLTYMHACLCIYLHTCTYMCTYVMKSTINETLSVSLCKCPRYSFETQHVRKFGFEMCTWIRVTQKNLDFYGVTKCFCAKNSPKGQQKWTKKHPTYFLFNQLHTYKLFNGVFNAIIKWYRAFLKC
jgi:hypothetical protein